MESVSDNINRGRAGTIELWNKIKSNLTSFVYDVINKGVDKQTLHAQKVRDIYRSILAKHGITKEVIKSWYEDSHKFELKDAKGRTKTFSFTTNELMSIFMHTRSIHNLSVLRKNGIDRFAKVGKIEIRGFTSEIIDQMTATLTQQQKDVAREVGSKLMDGANKVAMNETSQTLEGINIAIVKNYWPARRSLIRAIAGKKIRGVQSLIESMGILKERVGSGNPLKMSGFFETVYNTNKQVSAYVGLAPALRDVKATLSPDVIAEYERNGWGKEISVIKEFIERVEDNSPQVSPLNTVVGKLIGGFARSVFALNVKIWVRQQISSLLITSYVDTRHLGAFKGIATKEALDEIKSLSPQLAARFESFRFDRDIGDASLENELLEYLTGELNLNDKFLLGMKFFDTNAIVDVYRAAKSEIAELNPGLNSNSSEFKSQLKERFEWLVRHTQPVWHVKDRSLLGSSPNKLVRALTMFMSQREQMVRMVTGASVEYTNSNRDDAAISRLARVYGAVGLNLALFTLYNVAWAGLVRKKKQTIVGTFSQFVQNALGTIFFSRFATEILRNTTNAIQGRFLQVSFETGPQRILAEGATGLVYLNLAALHFITGELYGLGPNRNEKKWKNELLVAIDGLAQSFAGVRGLPYIGPQDILKGIRAWSEDINEDDISTVNTFR